MHAMPFVYDLLSTNAALESKSSELSAAMNDFTIDLTILAER
jgi:hypothetical protein